MREDLTLLVLLLLLAHAAAESIGTRPLHVDIEWVLQGQEINFSGFFTEFLGISSALVTKFPLMRLSKSLFLPKEDPGSEPALASEASLWHQLFPQEKTHLQMLLSTVTPRVQDIDHLVFDDKPVLVSEEICKPHNIEEYQHLSHGSFSSPNSSYMYENLAKFEATWVNSKEDCCFRCLQEPLCIAWNFTINTLHGVHNTASAGEGCHLKGHKVKFKEVIASVETATQTELNPNSNPIENTNDISDNSDIRGGARSGSESLTDKRPLSSFASVIAKRALLQTPRVLIFHGTACAYRNQTMSPYQNLPPLKRDGNTILIGRYMLERGADRSSFDAAEHQILHCAMLMDEVWVPSYWMADHLQRISQQMHMPMPEIVVVPEAVDVTLFRPREGDAKRYYGGGCDVASGNDDNGGNGDCSYSHGRDGDYCDSKRCEQEAECGIARSVLVANTKVGHDSDSALQQDRANDIVKPFQFLSIFKWEHRKGWDVLLKSYWTAFQASDNVVLRLQTYNPTIIVEKQSNISHNLEKYALELFNKPLSELARVVIADSHSAASEDAPVRSEVLTREQMRQLYAQADVFVLPTRGEGYCLPVAEAMAMMLPVIVTNHSGMTAYATDNNAYLIPVDNTTHNPFGYVEPDGNALVSLLHRAYRNATERRFKGEAGRVTMAGISPSYVANIMVARVRMLVGRRGWFDY